MNKLINIICLQVLFLLSNSFLYSNLIITTPSSTDIVSIGNQIEITWTNPSSSPVTLEYSTDNQNWDIIAQDINTDNYLWTVPYLEADSIFFKVTSSTYTPPSLMYTIENAHDAAINSIAISPDGLFLASASENGRLKVWSTIDWSLVNEINVGNNCYKIRFYRDSDNILIASGSNLYLYTLSNNTLSNLSSSNNFDFIKYFDIHNIDNLALLGQDDGEAIIFDIENQSILFTQNTGLNSNVIAAKFSDQGDKYILADQSGYISIYEYPSHNLLNQFQAHNLNIFDIDFNSDGTKFISGSVDSQIKQWNINDQTLITTITGHKGPIRELSYHPINSNLLLSASVDQSIRQWHLSNNNVVSYDSLNHAEQVLSAIYSTSGDTLFSAGRWNNNINIWYNFSGESISDTVVCALAYKAQIRIPHMEAKVRDHINIPLEYIAGNNLAQIENAFYDIKVDILVPKRLLYVFDRGMIARSNPIEKFDTLKLNLTNIQLSDTLYMESSLVVYGDTDFEEILIGDIEVIGLPKLDFEKIDGSIKIIQECEGQENRFIEFAENPITLNTYPNPGKENIFIDFNILEDGKNSLILYDINGNEIERFFDKTMKFGSYLLNVDIKNIPNGKYFIVLSGPNYRQSRKLTIIK